MDLKPPPTTTDVVSDILRYFTAIHDCLSDFYDHRIFQYVKPEQCIKIYMMPPESRKFRNAYINPSRSTFYVQILGYYLDTTPGIVIYKSFSDFLSVLYQKQTIENLAAKKQALYILFRANSKSQYDSRTCESRYDVGRLTSMRYYVEPKSRISSDHKQCINDYNLPVSSHAFNHSLKILPCFVPRLDALKNDDMKRIIYSLFIIKYLFVHYDTIPASIQSSQQNQNNKLIILSPRSVHPSIMNYYFRTQFGNRNFKNSKNLKINVNESKIDSLAAAAAAASSSLSGESLSYQEPVTPVTPPHLDDEKYNFNNSKYYINNKHLNDENKNENNTNDEFLNDLSEYTHIASPICFDYDIISKHKPLACWNGNIPYNWSKVDKVFFANELGGFGSQGKQQVLCQFPANCFIDSNDSNDENDKNGNNGVLDEALLPIGPWPLNMPFITPNLKTTGQVYNNFQEKVNVAKKKIENRDKSRKSALLDSEYCRDPYGLDYLNSLRGLIGACIKLGKLGNVKYYEEAMEYINDILNKDSRDTYKLRNVYSQLLLYCGKFREYYQYIDDHFGIKKIHSKDHCMSWNMTFAICKIHGFRHEMTVESCKQSIQNHPRILYLLCQITPQDCEEEASKKMFGHYLEYYYDFGMFWLSDMAIYDFIYQHCIYYFLDWQCRPFTLFMQCSNRSFVDSQRICVLDSSFYRIKAIDNDKNNSKREKQEKKEKKVYYGRELHNPVCKVCGKKDKNKRLYHCSKCDVVTYCSKECQEKYIKRGKHNRDECNFTKKLKRAYKHYKYVLYSPLQKIDTLQKMIEKHCQNGNNYSSSQVWKDIKQIGIGFYQEPSDKDKIIEKKDEISIVKNGNGNGNSSGSGNSNVKSKRSLGPRSKKSGKSDSNDDTRELMALIDSVSIEDDSDDPQASNNKSNSNNKQRGSIKGIKIEKP